MAIPLALQAAMAVAPAFVGSVVAMSGSRSADKRARKFNRELREQDREWFEEDRVSERDYAAGITAKDRRYFEKTTAKDRAYARNVLVDQRAYDRGNFTKDRAHDRGNFLADRNYDRENFEDDRNYDRNYAHSVRKDQRRYDEHTTRADRNYAARMLVQQRKFDQRTYNRDVHRYDKDREFMQKRSNNLARATAASRGIDFVKLRDDAIKAGYNPMTALSMAHAYSTQVDYSTQGGVYSPGANYTTSNQGYMPMSPSGSGSGGAGGFGTSAGGTSAGGTSGGGGSTVVPSTTMPSVAPAGGSFSAGGGGYQSDSGPALAAGSFVQDAMQRGLDLWSNQKQQSDPLADALRNAFAQDQMADQVRSYDYSRGFGYALTEQKAFQPAATVGVPALSSGKASMMPSGSIEVGGRKFVPVTKPDGKPGRLDASVARRLDIQPFDTVSPGDWAEIVGEVGEVETGFNQPGIRRNITDEWHVGVPIGNTIRDFVKSGVRGSYQFPSHSRAGNR